MKRQAHSTHTLSKYSGGPNLKSQNQLNANLGGNIEIQQKVEKIPTTFAFDTRIPPSEYKNYISIDDIYNENFEYARKLFEDPSRAFAVADYSSDHKIPRRLAQVNYKSYTAQENKREKKVNFANQSGQMSATVGGGNKFQKNEMSNNLYPPPPLHLQKKQQSHMKSKSQLKTANSIMSPYTSPHKQQQQAQDDVNFFKDFSPIRQQSMIPDYVHEQWNQQQKGEMDQSQLQKSQLIPQSNLHHQTSQQGQLPKDTVMLQSAHSIDQKKQVGMQSSVLKKKNSFAQPASQTNIPPLMPTKSTVALPPEGAQINNFTQSVSMKALPSQKKANEDRVQGLIAQTRDKVKRLQSYAEKLKRRVMQNDYGQNYKRSQKTIKKSQLVKNYIFNEEDFTKMLIQEEEEDKKNQANKKEKLKGFVDRQDAFALAGEQKKNPNSYQSQIIEQYNANKGFTKQKSAYQIQDDDDESDKSKDDLKDDNSLFFQKSDLKFKSKHNFHKKMVLKKRNFDEKVIIKEAEDQYDKVVSKLGKLQNYWDHLSIMPEKTNQLRAHSLQYARSGKILRTIGDKYGDLDLFVQPQEQKPPIKNEKDLLNHLQALLTKPDVSGDFKLHKQVKVHKDRIKNMRQKDVGITNISNISIEA